ncbi:unnamed protein product [Acanthoscelides obtectus]|uniref:Glucose-methanol-choline oxidoreductase N-terminal domain-containing protein n=1 Tax=Acanthoscelides obtectus TaxID=200917 RepID=A0A9P0M1L8_ACAOB|nr:unnamed protein product [Acanthoscelides obtectus]CAK1659700.1 Glucose dehydrogenase [FAD, quinone] [Acanthoscelides obtectus]
MSGLATQMNIFSVTRTMLTLGPALGFLVYMYSSILTMRQDIVDRDNRVKDVPLIELRKSYDFIVVGAGSAGAVVANRLSENPYWNVLLIEAGPDEVTLTDLPLLFPTLQLTFLDWQYKTEPGANYCLGLTNKRCNWPRGKVLGGSSVLNAMLYIRGNKKDYDRWEQLGNPGWRYEDVLPYFKKSEDMRIPELRDDPYHGKGGYLSVENFRYHSPMAQWYLDAARELGYDVLDVNAAQQTGFTLSHGTLRDGLRCSTAKAFLRPIKDRPNLHITMHSTVEKVLIHNDTMQAYGVVFDKFGVKRTVYAEREVILSAGSTNSPHLLMVSGVGPEAHLQAQGIDVIQDLPGVGQNLQDHLNFFGFFVKLDHNAEKPHSPLTNLDAVYEYFTRRTGAMAGISITNLIGFINTKNDSKYPNVQLHHMLLRSADPYLLPAFSKAVGFKDESVEKRLMVNANNPALIITSLILNPKSRGDLELRSKDIYEAPVIRPKYLTDPEEHDLNTHLEAIRYCQALLRTASMSKHNPELVHDVIPACDQFPYDSDEYWKCAIRHMSGTLYHPVGTCKMGPKDESTAVVDSKLRVIGVNRLRVADASVMPTVTSGNTNAPTMMIGRKAGVMIAGYWSKVKDEL